MLFLKPVMPLCRFCYTVQYLSWFPWLYQLKMVRDATVETSLIVSCPTLCGGSVVLDHFYSKGITDSNCIKARCHVIRGHCEPTMTSVPIVATLYSKSGLFPFLSNRVPTVTSVPVVAEMRSNNGPGS